MADDATSSPKRHWALLRGGHHDASEFSIPTRPAGVSTSAGPIRFALGEHGEARLLLPLEPRAELTGSIEAPAMRIRTTALSSFMSSTPYLDIECRVRDLETVFAEVVEQIIERVQAGATSVQAVTTTVEEFRALLMGGSRTQAPREKVAGLVGELLLLNDLLERSAEGWKAWRGPEGARHDFVMNATAFEVKVTMKKGKGTLQINGLEQLSEPAGGALFLQHYEIEAATNGPLSIARLGNAALARASEPQRVAALIAALGCPGVDDEAWNAESFRLEGDRIYRVAPGFPRLTSADFPSGKAPTGVSAVTYNVDLGCAQSHLLEVADMAAAKEKLLP